MGGREGERTGGEEYLGYLAEAGAGRGGGCAAEEGGLGREGSPLAESFPPQIWAVR